MSEKEKILEALKLLIDKCYYIFNNQGYLFHKREYNLDCSKYLVKLNIGNLKFEDRDLEND